MLGSMCIWDLPANKKIIAPPHCYCIFCCIRERDEKEGAKTETYETMLFGLHQSMEGTP